jgi:hypothetical protein
MKKFKYEIGDTIINDTNWKYWIRLRVRGELNDNIYICESVDSDEVGGVQSEEDKQLYIVPEITIEDYAD